ncbi:DUF378 domain-containing protein [Rickettsiales bacterium LUAb2]
MENLNKRLNKLVPAALILTLIGGVNWLLIGLFNFNIVIYIAHWLHFEPLEKITYIVIGLSALLSMKALYQKNNK